MARPIKDGVMYFPFDVDFFQDEKVRLIKAEFGVKSITVLLYILCEIYRTNGYFLKWDKRSCLLMSDGVGGGVSSEYISEVVHGCVKCSFFDERVLNMFGVLTSAGIQRRYIKMLNKRTSILLIKEYWLLDFSEEEISDSVLDKCTFKAVLGEKTPVLGEKTPVLGEKNSQIKLNKIKLNNIGGKSSRFVPPTLEEVTRYCKERGNKVNPEKWFNHYVSNGWMVGKNKMKNWKAAVRTWEHNEYSKDSSDVSGETSYDVDEIRRYIIDQ